MPSAPPAPPNSPLGHFGREVRHYRETNTKLSQKDLGQKIGYSESIVHMIESGRRNPSLDFAERCDDVLINGGALTRLWPVVKATNALSWFDDYQELEKQAIAIHGWNPEWIPGLFQTEDYMRELFRCWRAHAPGDIDGLVETRRERQHNALRSDGPEIWMLVGEAALRRVVGGVDVWRAQLEHFADQFQNSHRWVLQVLPFLAGAHALSDGAICLLSFSDAADVVFADGPGVGRLVDRSEDVRQFRFRFDHDRSRALTPEESLTFINNLIQEHQ